MGILPGSPVSLSYFLLSLSHVLKNDTPLPPSTKGPPVWYFSEMTWQVPEVGSVSSSYKKSLGGRDGVGRTLVSAVLLR